MAAKREDAQRAAAETEELKQKQQAQNQEDFDDLLKGKAPRKRTEDMNLQELFKTYYTKAKEADKAEKKAEKQKTEEEKSATLIEPWKRALEKRKT